MRSPKHVTYEDWRSLEAEERVAIQNQWSASGRDGYAVTLAVAGEFIRQSPIPILFISAGISLQQQWVIYAWVNKSHIGSCTQGLYFEGFQIFYYEHAMSIDLKPSCISFDEWIACPDEEILDHYLSWNADKREGFDVILRAAGWLIQSSDAQIVYVECVPYQQRWFIHAQIKGEYLISVKNRDFYHIPVYWSALNP